METASRLVFVFLLNGLWQIPLVAAASWLAARLLRNGPAAHRHAIWIAALLAALALPLASLRTTAAPSPRQAIAYRPPAAPVTTTKPTPSTAPRPTAAEPLTLDYAPLAATALLALYLCLTLYRAARLAWAWRNAARLRVRAHAQPLPLPVATAYTRARAALGATRTQLLWSSHVASPVMTGVIRKSVILPDSLLAESSDHVLLTALGHELGHAWRNDFAWNLFYELLALPVACHPAVAFLLARIRETRELACDELVTRRLIAPHDYARSMVAIAAQMHAAVEPGFALGVFDGNILEERVRRLLDAPTRLRYARLWLAAGFAAIALCAVLANGLAVSAQSQTDQPALDNEMRAALGTQRYADARLWAKQILKGNAGQLDALYTLGFTAWTLAYPDLRQAHDPAAYQAFRVKHAAAIDDGIASLRALIEADPNYSGAMAYLNLLLRMKADVADTPSESAALTEEADEWMARALTAQRRTTNSQTPPPPPLPPPPPNVGNALVSSTPASPHHGPGRAGTYWQVTGSMPIGVQDLIRSLKSAGFPAMEAIVGQDADIRVYVMAGPYQASQLDQAKSALEAAGYRVIEKW